MLGVQLLVFNGGHRVWPPVRECHLKFLVQFNFHLRRCCSHASVI